MPVKKNKKEVKKRVAKKVVKLGKAYILATFNNTIITLSDSEGNVLVQKSPVHVGFKGTKKSTPYAATKAAKEAAEVAIKKYGLSEVHVVIKGPGVGRSAAVKGLDTGGLRILSMMDMTPIPHNGCRPKKERRT